MSGSSRTHLRPASPLRSRSVLRSNGYAAQPVTLALPASMCFPAAISIADLPRGDRRAMTYRLEERIPFAAESVVADFIVTGDRALGACVRPDEIWSLLDACAAAGVDVAAIAPAALLAAQGCGPVSAELLVLPEAEQVNLLALQRGAVTAWATAPTAAGAEAQVRAMWPDAPPASVAVTSDVDDEFRAALARMSPSGAVTDLGVDSVAAIARTGGEIAAGRREPLVNFRRDSLAVRDPIDAHRRPLNALLAAAAVLLLSITVAAGARAHRYATAERRAEVEMRTAFLGQFPGLGGADQRRGGRERASEGRIGRCRRGGGRRAARVGDDDARGRARATAGGGRSARHADVVRRRIVRTGGARRRVRADRCPKRRRSSGRIECFAGADAQGIGRIVDVRTARRRGRRRRARTPRSPKGADDERAGHEAAHACGRGVHGGGGGRVCATARRRARRRSDGRMTCVACASSSTTWRGAAAVRRSRPAGTRRRRLQVSRH
jgi:hypothetical protein